MNTLTRPSRGHRREEIEVAQHEIGFGDDADGMAGARQDLENGAGDAIAPLDRLIGVGVGAERDDPRAVLRRRELALEQRRRPVLDEQLRLEIEAGGKAEIGVARPGETIDAAVLAAAIGIDRAVEGNVGRFVAGDDGSRSLQRDLGFEGRRRLVRRPAVVEVLAAQKLEPPRDVRGRAAAAPAVGVD